MPSVATKIKNVADCFSCVNSFERRTHWKVPLLSIFKDRANHELYMRIGLGANAYFRSELFFGY